MLTEPWNCLYQYHYALMYPNDQVFAVIDQRPRYELTQHFGARVFPKLTLRLDTAQLMMSPGPGCPLRPRVHRRSTALERGLD